LRFHFSRRSEQHDSREKEFEEDVMSTATLISPATLHAYSRLLDAVYVPIRARHAKAARRAATIQPARPRLSWLDRLDRWFDGMTDDRAELERYLARAQSIADLENRMRDALNPQPPLRF
jgi:hypothetical protein